MTNPDAASSDVNWTDSMGEDIESLYCRGGIVWMKNNEARKALQPLIIRFGEVPVVCALGALDKLLTLRYWGHMAGRHGARI